LQELDRIDSPIVPLLQVGSKLAWPDHHTEVWNEHHAASQES
jgi:hypothetical protein